MAANIQPSGGLGLPGFVFIVFLVMKLTHYIDWSWWWVTAPLWIPFIVVIIAAFIILAVESNGR
jgi:hypothetical protein